MHNSKKLRMFYEHQTSTQHVKQDKALQCLSGISRRISEEAAAQPEDDVNPGSIGSNKKDFKDDASSRGTETSQDFTKVENFYFAKRSGEDRSYTCSTRRRAGPEDCKVHLEDVQSSSYHFVHSFILKTKIFGFSSQ